MNRSHVAESEFAAVLFHSWHLFETGFQIPATRSPKQRWPNLTRPNYNNSATFRLFFVLLTGRWKMAKFNVVKLLISSWIIPFWPHALWLVGVSLCPLFSLAHASDNSAQPIFRMPYWYTAFLIEISLNLWKGKLFCLLQNYLESLNKKSK